MPVRISQQLQAVLGYSDDADARVGQQIVETLGYSDDVVARVSQHLLNILGSSDDANARVSLQLAEALAATSQPNARVSLQFIEVLIANWEKSVLTIFPTLDGLTYDVEWAPGFFNLEDKTVTGAKIDLGLAEYPLHEFTLTYSVLRNGFMFDPQTYGGTEFKTMMGFFLQAGGTLGRFLFDNPDDDAVVGQAQGTTDGVTSTFGPLVRTFGVADYNATEPIGVVNIAQTFNLYLDGVLQDPTSYDVLTDVPMEQQVKFHVTPTTGQAITNDMTYYYYCKLPSDTLTFRKFMQKLWDLGQIKIESCRELA